MIVSWETDALPVLKALADCETESVRDGFMSVRAESNANPLGLQIDGAIFIEVLLALSDVGFVQIDDLKRYGGSVSVLGARVTGRGMRALGEWPALEAAMTPATMVAVLDRLCEFAPDIEGEEHVHRAAAAISRSAPGVVRQTAVAFGAAAIRAKLGLR